MNEQNKASAIDPVSDPIRWLNVNNYHELYMAILWLPSRMQVAVAHHIVNGCGHNPELYLPAVYENDFRAYCNLVDAMPRDSWGSAEAVNNWKGLAHEDGS